MTAEARQGVIPQWTLLDKIRKAREYAGLSQQELADRLSVTRGSVINWERGHTVPLLPLLRMLAEATGVDSEWLTEDWSSKTRGGYMEGAGLPRVDSNHQPFDVWPDITRPRSLREAIPSFRKKLPIRIDQVAKAHADG